MRALPLSDTDQGTERAPRTVSVASNREEAEDYRAIVARLNERWRVIVCKDGIQWILQRQYGTRDGKPIWRSKSFCRNREALIRVCRKHAGEIDPKAMAVLEALPRMIGGSR
jgi:hypothetical protein